MNCCRLFPQFAKTRSYCDAGLLPASLIAEHKAEVSTKGSVPGLVARAAATAQVVVPVNAYDVSAHRRAAKGVIGRMEDPWSGKAFTGSTALL